MSKGETKNVTQLNQNNDGNRRQYVRRRKR